MKISMNKKKREKQSFKVGNYLESSTTYLNRREYGKEKKRKFTILELERLI